MPRMTIPEIINELKAELTFVEDWMKKDPEGMKGFLLGKQATLKEAIRKLEDYNRP